jgi:hypothetical protein
MECDNVSFVTEYAKTDISRCTLCNELISKEFVRIAIVTKVGFVFQNNNKLMFSLF